MSSRKRKKQIEEMAARACARLAEERRPYKEIYELLENGSDEELAERIDRAAAEGSDILHYLDEYGFQLIHSAARMNRAAALAPLVRAGFGVNDKGGEGGRTPIHIAAAHGAAEAARELVALGADVRARDADGNTPMHSAARYAKETDGKQFETIKILLDAGADPHAKDVFRLEPVNWFRTKQAQRRFLALAGEESEGGLPPRYEFTYDYDGRLILAVNDKSLRHGKISD